MYHQSCPKIKLSNTFLNLIDKEDKVLRYFFCLSAQQSHIEIIEIPHSYIWNAVAVVKAGSKTYTENGWKVVVGLWKNKFGLLSVISGNPWCGKPNNKINLTGKWRKIMLKELSKWFSFNLGADSLFQSWVLSQ